MTCAIHTNTLLEHMYQLIQMSIKMRSLGNIALNWRISSLHEINYAHEIEWKMWFYLLRDSKVVAISSVQMAQLIWQSFDKFSLELTPWSGLLLLVLTWCYLFLVITDLTEFLFKLKRRHDLDNRKNCYCVSIWINWSQSNVIVMLNDCVIWSVVVEQLTIRFAYSTHNARHAKLQMNSKIPFCQINRKKIISDVTSFPPLTKSSDFSSPFLSRRFVQFIRLFTLESDRNSKNTRRKLLLIVCLFLLLFFVWKSPIDTSMHTEHTIFWFGECRKYNELECDQEQKIKINNLLRMHDRENTVCA